MVPTLPAIPVEINVGARIFWQHEEQHVTAQLHTPADALQSANLASITFVGPNQVGFTAATASHKLTTTNSPLSFPVVKAIPNGHLPEAELSRSTWNTIERLQR